MTTLTKQWWSPSEIARDGLLPFGYGAVLKLIKSGQLKAMNASNADGLNSAKKPSYKVHIDEINRFAKTATKA